MRASVEFSQLEIFTRIYRVPKWKNHSVTLAKKTEKIRLGLQEPHRNGLSVILKRFLTEFLSMSLPNNLFYHHILIIEQIVFFPIMRLDSF
jgi:hypothetical protein